MPRITQGECGGPAIETPVCLDAKTYFNYSLSPPRAFCSLKLSLFPGPCIIPRTLEMRDRENKDYCAHFTDEEANPGGAESLGHKVPRKLELPLYPTVLVCPHAQALPIT